MASTQAHRNPPFRAEHLGSLLRPKALLDARSNADAATKKTDKEIAALTDQSIKDALEMQKKLGFHAFTDGEYRCVYCSVVFDQAYM